MASVDVRPTGLDLSVDQGDDFALTFDLTSATSAQLTAIGSATITASVFNSAGTEVLALTTGWSSPLLTVSATDTQIDGLETGRDRYRWQLKVDDGEPGAVWLAGSFEVSAPGVPGSGSSGSSVTVQLGEASVPVTIAAVPSGFASTSYVDAATSQLRSWTLSTSGMREVAGSPAWGGTTTGNFYGWLLGAGVFEAVGVSVRSPVTGTVQATFRCAPAASAPAGDVRLAQFVRSRAPGETPGASASSPLVVSVTGKAQYEMFEATMPTPAAVTEGDLVLLAFARTGNDPADTEAGDLIISEVSLDWVAS